MQHKQDSRDQAKTMDDYAQNNGQVFATQNNGQVFATQNNGQVFATQNNGQVFDTQNNGQIFAAQNNGQVFDTQNNGQVFATKNNGQVFATQNNGQEFDTQKNGQVFAAQNNGQVFTTQNNGQVFATQNNGQELDTQFPFVDQEPPRPTYPPPYTTFAQQQNVSATGMCRSIFVGRISMIWLGSLLVVSTVMSQAGAIVALGFSAGLSESCAGMWCGGLFIIGGIGAIIAGRRETKKLISQTIVYSALAIVASVILLGIAGTGLISDIDSYSCYPPCDPHAHWQNCPSYYDDWKTKAVAGNATMVGAAALAFIAGLWILAVACIAIRRNPAIFQDVSAQVIANTGLHNVYENNPHQQHPYSEPVQHVQQPQQQLISLSHLPSNTAYQPTLSQVMDMPPSYIPMQTIPNQQMHSMPVQFGLQQQHQQQIPLNYLQPSTIAQGQENHAFTQEHADDVKTALESKWN